MRTLVFLWFRAALCMVALTALRPPSLVAQSPEGWLNDNFSGGTAQVIPAPGGGASQSLTVADGFAPPNSPPVPPPPPPGLLGGTSSSPDEITPEIATLTRSVINGPGSGTALAKCFLFVTNELDYEHYYGCKKGALLTYLERKGNDADLATLLAAMLRSAGYTVRYSYGVVGYPFTGDPNNIDVQNWLGLSADVAYNFFLNRGFPNYWTDGGNGRYLHRVWVEVQEGTTWVRLDPAFKRRVRIMPKTDLTAWLANPANYNRATLKAQAGGTLAPGTPSLSIEGINYDGANGLSAYLSGQASALLSYLETNHDGTDATSLLGGWRREPVLFGGSQYFMYGSPQPANPPYWSAAQTFSTLPDWLLTKLTLEVRTVPAGTLVASHVMPMAHLQGRRLSLTFTTQDSTGKAQLWLDDTLLPPSAQETTNAVGTAVELKIDINHPHSNSFGATLHDQFSKKNYLRGGRYALVYSFNPTRELLKARQEQLETYRRSPGVYPDTSLEVVTETLNVIGLTWMHQTELIERAIDGKTNCDPIYHHRMGRVAQEGNPGTNSMYYIDVDAQFDGGYSLDGDTAQKDRAFDAVNYCASAMEHGVIEQMQGAANPSVSTVKMLKLGNAQAAGSGKTYYANSQSTWNTSRPALVATYSASDLARLDLAISQGGEVLVPQKGNLNLNQFTGAGYITRVNTATGRETKMVISDGLHGGFNSKVPSTVNPAVAAGFFNTNPLQTNTTPLPVPRSLSFDPIDLASGDYVLPATDLEVGAAAPRGFTFSRQYHSGRAKSNPAGLGYGWTHNWLVRATRRSAYEPALGVGGTPLDVAATLVAMHATLDLASVAPDAQHWTLASLVAQWLTDQLQDNAVSISIGERSLQFLRRPDGAWQAPGGVKMTLIPYNGGWQAEERHGNKYNFDPAGKLVSIVDLWSKTLNVGYTGDKVASVTDAYGRSMTFSYIGNLLDKVTDNSAVMAGTGPARLIQFVYNGSDLTIVADPENKLDLYLYDGEHRIWKVLNHDYEVVAVNVYGTDGKVIEQPSQGDAVNRKWKYSYSPNCSVEENPHGAKTCYYFDDRKRQIGRLDASGRYASTGYDGQDRVTQTSTPLGFTTIRTYDRFHNVRSFKDQDDKITSYDFDAANDLRTITDPLTHARTLTYNGQHQPLTIRNHYQQGITNTYNPGSGTLATSADDAGKTTQYGYNGRDELTTTTLPGTGTDRTETILRTVYGDPQTMTDRRGYATSYTYNLRRQVKTVTQPGLPPVTHDYDGQRRLWSVTDARSSYTSYVHSPTGKLLTTMLPAAGGGVATISETYDSRDWKATAGNPRLPGEPAETTTFYYYDTGELLERDDPTGRFVYFGYDNDSRPTLAGDGLYHESQTGYNGRGLVTSLIDQRNKSSTNDYDNAGRRWRFTNRRSQPFAFGYDNADRPTSTTTPNQRTSAQTWNGRNLVETMTEPSGEGTVLAYDDRGRLMTRTDNVGAVGYTYDGNNNLKTVTQGAATIVRTYDPRNRLESYDDGRGHVLGYGYDANGNLTSLTYEPGKTVTYTYDERNRLTDVWDWTGRHTALAYDGAGRLTTLTRPNGTWRTNTWDGAGRLLTAMDKRANAVPLLALRLDYDAAGRLKDKLETPAWGPQGSLPPRIATYNNDNQVATFTMGGATRAIGHDLDGNVTSAPGISGSNVLQSYGWNARNQLTSCLSTSYSYDAEGLRTSYTAGGQTTTFVNDPGGAMSRVLVRIRPNGTRTFYIYGPVLLYEIEESAGGGNPANAARCYHYDHLGSTIALSNDAGQVTGRAGYSAYGIWLNAAGVMNTPFMWQGAFGVQTDPNGLHHMRARYYHAVMGRFLSEDPLGLAAGPNVYAYCSGNPVTLNDPAGLCGSPSTYQGYDRSFAADAQRIEFLNSPAAAEYDALMMTPGERALVSVANLATNVVLEAMLPEVLPLRGAGAVARAGQAVNGPVIIGETMVRVEQAAAKIPGSKILNDMPDFRSMGMNANQVTSSMMQYNRKWILEQMRSGREIIDIGADANRASSSIFYQMEQNMLRNYQKLHPEFSGAVSP